MSRILTPYSDSVFYGFRLKEDFCPYVWYQELLELMNAFYQKAFEFHKDDKRTLTGRFDFTFPATYDDATEGVFNHFLSEFMKTIDPDLKPFYFWVCERDQTIHPHYHLLLAISKKKNRSLHYLYTRALLLWCKHLQIPTIYGYVSEHPNHTIKWTHGYTSNNPTLVKAFHHAAYLCKCKEKNNLPLNFNLYGHSKSINKKELYHADSTNLL